MVMIILDITGVRKWQAADYYQFNWKLLRGLFNFQLRGQLSICGRGRECSIMDLTIRIFPPKRFISWHIFGKWFEIFGIICCLGLCCAFEQAAVPRQYFQTMAHYKILPPIYNTFPPAQIKCKVIIDIQKRLSHCGKIIQEWSVCFLQMMLRAPFRVNIIPRDPVGASLKCKEHHGPWSTVLIT